MRIKEVPDTDDAWRHAADPTYDNALRADLNSELRKIQNSPSPITRIKPYVRPLSVKLRLGIARIWKNKGLFAGSTLFSVAAFEVGTVPGLVVAGISCIVAEFLT